MRTSPECVITGCDFVMRHQWCHGDLHRVGDVLVFNACINEHGEAFWNQGTYAKASHGLAVLVDPNVANPIHERRGTIVVHSRNCVLSPAAEAYLSRRHSN